MRGRAELNTGLAAAELVDDLCLTLSPRLAGRGRRRALAGERAWLSRERKPASREHRCSDLGLVHVLEENSFLFLRLRPNYEPSSRSQLQRGFSGPLSIGRPVAATRSRARAGAPGAPPSIGAGWGGITRKAERSISRPSIRTLK